MVAPFSDGKCLTWLLFVLCVPIWFWWHLRSTQAAVECVLHATRMDIGKFCIEIMSIGKLSAPKKREVIHRRHWFDVSRWLLWLFAVLFCATPPPPPPSLCFALFSLNWMSIDGLSPYITVIKYGQIQSEANEMKQRNTTTTQYPSIPFDFCELLLSYTPLRQCTNEWMSDDQFYYGGMDGVRL